ncbi:MAG: phosphatidylglycerophosphatase, partial [Paenibacillus sp.]|nr:phosphatidylglycerophosphatase [Paenibacillus sp.]
YRKWLEPLLLLINLAIAFGLYKGLKELFERPRPSVEALIEASGYGFPSGNALLSSAVYGFAAYALYRLWSKRHPMRSRTAAAIGILLVLAIGVSRVYLGVHYPSDIIAGYCLGTALLLVTGERIGKR